MFRARAVIFRDEHIALIKRERSGRTYYVLPGGGSNPGETPAQTAIRECFEETGLEISIHRLLAKVIYHNAEHYIFLANVRGGSFGSGKGPEMIGLYPPESGTFTPVWMPLAQIEQIDFYPETIASLLSAYPASGWPDQIHEFVTEEKTSPNEPPSS